MPYIVQHRPAYFSGFENERVEFKKPNRWDTKSSPCELFEIEFVKNFSTLPGFYGYFASVSTDAKNNFKDYKITLMALYNYNEEYYGCESWWVIGTVFDMLLYETNLKRYISHIRQHKWNCWSKIYSANESILNSLEIDEKVVLKRAKEMGWTKDTLNGIAGTCTCGYNEKFNK